MAQTMTAQTIADVMTPDPVVLAPTTSLAQAAILMRDLGIGDVLVADDEQLRGLVTDRDIVVRAVAESRDPDTTTLGEVCTSEVFALTPDDPIDEAIRLMGENAIRRVPVVELGRPVGIVAIGDLAVHLDPSSALADISAAEPNV